MFLGGEKNVTLIFMSLLFVILNQTVSELMHLLRDSLVPS